jgi:hypothetical protein
MRETGLSDETSSLIGEEEIGKVHLGESVAQEARLVPMRVVISVRRCSLRRILN